MNPFIVVRNRKGFLSVVTEKLYKSEKHGFIMGCEKPENVCEGYSKILEKRYLYMVAIVLIAVVLMGSVSYNAMTDLRDTSKASAELNNFFRGFDHISFHTIYLSEVADMEGFEILKTEIDEAIKEVDEYYNNLQLMIEEGEFSASLLESKSFFIQLTNDVINNQYNIITLAERITSGLAEEKELRYSLFDTAVASKDPELISNVWAVRYYSKEVLFQYMDQKHYDEWLEAIMIMKNSISPTNDNYQEFMSESDVYYDLASNVGSLAVEKEKMEQNRIVLIQQLESNINAVNRDLLELARDFQDRNDEMLKSLFWKLMATAFVCAALVLAMFHVINRDIRKILC
jgi:hypothetical protein